MSARLRLRVRTTNKSQESKKIEAVAKCKCREPEDIVFAKVGDAYIAGVNIDTIVSDAGSIYPEVRYADIKLVSEDQIPKEYSFSVKRVKEFREWTTSGNATYLLMKHFERSAMCSHYFPELREKYEQFWGMNPGSMEDKDVQS